MVDDARAAKASLLRALRVSRGFTQQEIADRSELTERSIRDIELGVVTRPRTDSLLRIAAALDLSGVETTAFVRAYRGATDGAESEPVRPATPVVAPAELPRDLPDFVGRTLELEHLSDPLRNQAAPIGSSSTTIVISGAGGLGKSSLAIHAGHLLAPDFPDGQLFVDLSTDSVHDALGELLWSFGMREDIPKSRRSRVRMMRSLTARTRALIVIDNVSENARVADVADLVPSGAGNAVIVTSRSRMSGLYANFLIELTPLTVGQSVNLLSSAAGHAASDLTAVQGSRIAHLCGMHPLALRVCGARLSARRGLSAT
ncbi:MAG: NB-ARC domain-containing protein, partial [Nocardioidaceae bacterium]